MNRPSAQRVTPYTALLALLAALLFTTWPTPGHTQAQPPAADPATATLSDIGQQSRALERALQSVVGLQALAIDGARSARTLGPLRQGSGVVIGADGLVLTIGYLVLEADAVSLQRSDGRQVPARVLAYDVATGLGLVQALAPLGVAPVPLAATPLALQEPHTLVSGGDDGEVSAVRLQGQRPFAGYWEYHLERALLTAPARRDHSGAGLFNAQGELVGIGALYLGNSRALLGPDAPNAGPSNLFVPADLLPPILDELRRNGRSRASVRAWLGLNCVEVEGRVRVVRVTDDSPADVAGLAEGDQIIGLDGQAVQSLGALWQALWAGGPAERAVQLDIQRAGQALRLTVHTVDRAKTLRRAQGI